MAPKNCVGVLKILCLCVLTFLGIPKFVGTCTQNLNFVGTQICGYSNLWVLKIYLYSNFAGLRFVGTPKIVGTQFFWYSYSKNY